MEYYSKQPSRFGRRWLAVMAAGIVGVGAPYAISAALPEYHIPPEQVTPQTLDQKHQYPIAGLECPRNPDSTQDKGWRCDAALVDVAEIEGVKDLTTTLKRSVRKVPITSMDEVQDSVIADAGDTHIAVDSDVSTVAIAREIDGSDSHFVVTTVQGPRDDARRATAKIWASLAGGELPANIAAALDDFSEEDPNNPGVPDEPQLPNDQPRGSNR